MADAQNHDYHLVNPSPWPFIASFGVLLLTVGAVMHLHDYGSWVMGLGFVMILYVMYGWWRDVVREANQGDHTPVVQIHHRYAMVLFIASEVMFFVAWFWGYFDASLMTADPLQKMRTALTGGEWPPKGIETFDPWHLPLINTLILLTSGTTLTWAHHALQHGDREGFKWGLILTVLLGMLFSVLQVYEYAHAAFGFSGHIYGATFYMATGFHGFHVLVGTIFLLVCLIRGLRGDFTPKHHLGFEAAAWYWHFVDVVWLFLFIVIYVLGASIPAAH